MVFSELLHRPGEHLLSLSGKAGLLEAILTIPDEIHTTTVAFLGHPHSLQGGTMNNKVVTTCARAFKELGIPSLRFNFRGVGQSAGVYDAGIGESEDMLHLVRMWTEELPLARALFVGFSFGSYVAYRAASQSNSVLLITIAPPVHHYDYQAYHPNPHPWIIIQGDADEVVPAHLVLDFAKCSSPEIPVVEFADTGHFFHGKLLDLKAQLVALIRAQGLTL